jgi:hypothetical protein
MHLKIKKGLLGGTITTTIVLDEDPTEVSCTKNYIESAQLTHLALIKAYLRYNNQ